MGSDRGKGTCGQKKKKKDRDEDLFLSFFLSFFLPHRRKGSFGGEPLRTSMIYE